MLGDNQANASQNFSQAEPIFINGQSQLFYNKPQYYIKKKDKYKNSQ